MSNSNSEDRTKFNRRQALLWPATAGLGATLAPPANASDSTKTAVHQQVPAACSTPRSAVAKTQYGKVRGFVDGGVLTFKGIPYGQTTAGENRWLPTKPPKPWEGEYPALIYGPNCPQNLHSWDRPVAQQGQGEAVWGSIEQSFIQDWDDGYQGEDMLKLNVWTPALTGKRAVMVYFHGGGFSFGSSYELPSHEGAQMARHHDVVQVSVNHRLNILGFFDLSEIGGPAYADSVNCGMMDLVASLKWVHENIANFGGDPDRVMIYGQSGGGSKVTTLLGMPSAVGLIHRASIQSGGGGNPPGADASREFARQVMKELALGPNDIASLQKMEWTRLNAAANSAATRINGPLPAGRGPGGPAAPPRVGSGPTVDGRIITLKSFNDAIADTAKNIPILIGSVSEEGNSMGSRPTEEQWRATLARTWGEAKGRALADAMMKKYPKKSVRLLSYGVNGINSRNNVTRMATLKYNQKGAPVYAYWFTWQSPMLEDAGAWHTAELAFCFDNTKRCEQGTGNTPEAQALARKMATAWANHAKTGNPSQPGLIWAPFTAEKCEAMVWDNQCRMVNDPEGDLRKILSQS
ncbi:MAG: carboxylesterase family protein [Acidobacteriia bacterium]|nr:carboxylesterase family protein [Terriglobia bacterium]